MWILRDLLKVLPKVKGLPVKILKGPRQCGKTTLLEKLGHYQSLCFDDLSVRQLAQNNPKYFFEQFKGPLLLDEATHAPEIFLEIKRKVDFWRRNKVKENEVDIWITGSNQTLLRKNIQESLAGRASYYNLNTLSLHELKNVTIADFMRKGGWPLAYKGGLTLNLSHCHHFQGIFLKTWC